jgi:hypothetical protein
MWFVGLGYPSEKDREHAMTWGYNMPVASMPSRTHGSKALSEELI